MIGYLKGEVRDGGLIFTTSGVGYQVALPYYISGECELYIETIVKENDISLYGFKTLDEKIIFTSLLRVPKIGPSTALQVMITYPIDEFLKIVRDEDVAKLSKVKGLGKTASDRFFSYYKLPTLTKEYPMDTADKTTFPDTANLAEPLIALGFERGEALMLINKILQKNPELLELSAAEKESTLVKLALGGVN